MKKINFLLVALTLTLTFSAHSGPVNEIKIAEVWAGGVNVNNNPGGRAYTRLRLSRSISTSCTDKNTVAIRSGILINENGTAPSPNQMVFTEIYQQQFSLAVAANTRNSNVDLFVLNSCTPDGRLAIVDRITLK